MNLGLSYVDLECRADWVDTTEILGVLFNIEATARFEYVR